MNNQNEIETYANITAFPNYQISTFGNCKNIKTGRVLKPGIGSHGYYHVTLTNDGKRSDKKIHKLVAGVFLQNPEDKKCVDHIDRDSLNNHLSNLRYATHSENNQNVSIKSNNTSGVAGVSWNKQRKKWQAYIKLNYIKKNLGYFVNKDDAITARTNAEILYFGDFRAVNQIV